MSKPYPSDVRERALQTALDRLHEYPSPYAAAVAFGPSFGVEAEILGEYLRLPATDHLITDMAAAIPGTNCAHPSSC
ncbi:hypothetical protein EV641_106165 [Rhodococcus sp. SMB37]|uniref:hypothetical protein n=1 Tax=Rhodococcus sp. SMB37 TaxID=2512213 RepID=UPI001048959D|nr:hypothetical protein [Rhodococcus sp. SMB37]TCN53519.1 hypothetical protein EV641_106165 [Rhodococcus sp. SMB37]